MICFKKERIKKMKKNADLPASGPPVDALPSAAWNALVMYALRSVWSVGCLGSTILPYSSSTVPRNKVRRNISTCQNMSEERRTERLARHVRRHVRHVVGDELFHKGGGLCVPWGKIVT